MEVPCYRTHYVRGLLVRTPGFIELYMSYLAWAAGLADVFADVALRTWAQTHLHYRLKLRKGWIPPFAAQESPARAPF